MSKQSKRLEKLVNGLTEAIDSQDSERGFKLIADKIERLENENKTLDKELDTVNENYKKVGEYYNLAFSFFADIRGEKVITIVGEFYNWLKPELREGE